MTTSCTARHSSSGPEARHAAGRGSAPCRGGLYVGRAAACKKILVARRSGESSFVAPSKAGQRTPAGPPPYPNPTTRRRTKMRVMVMVKATKNSEAGVMPSEQLIAEMGKFNEELIKAGVMLAGDGLHPSSKGKRVRFGGGKKTVIDGPFAETKELVAGFWIWQVQSMEEALEWVRRCPDPMPGEESEIEIRPVFEAEDFGEEFTPELRAQEEQLRAELERRQKS